MSGKWLVNVNFIEMAFEERVEGGRSRRHADIWVFQADGTACAKTEARVCLSCVSKNRRPVSLQQSERGG